MNPTRILVGITVGGLSTSIMLAISGYLISLYVPSNGGNFISLPNPEIIGMIVGGVFGGIIGGLSGVLIIGFELNFIKAIALGLLINTFISVFLVFWTGDDPFYNNSLKYLLISLIISGIINGAIVSSIHGGQKSN